MGRKTLALLMVTLIGLVGMIASMAFWTLSDTETLDSTPCDFDSWILIGYSENDSDSTTFTDVDQWFDPFGCDITHVKSKIYDSWNDWECAVYLCVVSLTGEEVIEDDETGTYNWEYSDIAPDNVMGKGTSGGGTGYTIAEALGGPNYNNLRGFLSFFDDNSPTFTITHCINYDPNCP